MIKLNEVVIEPLDNGYLLTGRWEHVEKYTHRKIALSNEDKEIAKIKEWLEGGDSSEG